jgi:hypothetical protein
MVFTNTKVGGELTNLVSGTFSNRYEDSVLSLIQTLKSKSASNHSKSSGRNWDVRGVVGFSLNPRLIN